MVIIKQRLERTSGYYRSKIKSGNNEKNSVIVITSNSSSINSIKNDNNNNRHLFKWRSYLWPLTLIILQIITITINHVDAFPSNDIKYEYEHDLDGLHHFDNSTNFKSER